MKTWKDILTRHQTLAIWYIVLLFCCFVGVYFLAGSYVLVQFCDDGVHFLEKTICGRGLGPLIVKMDSETFDVRVEPLKLPLTFTEGIGYHVMGTDALGRDVFAGILYGGQRSLLIGLLAGGLAMGMGWLIGLWSVFVRWSQRRFPFFWMGLVVVILLTWLTQVIQLLLLGAGLIIFRIWMNKRKVRFRSHVSAPWWWSRWIEWYQALPDLLLILVLSAAIGVINLWGLVLIITAVIWPSMALIARRVGSEVTQQPYFRQALRNKVSGRSLIFHYLWGNTRSVFQALFPLVVARVILLESTISFLGLGLPPDMVTIGSMISASRHNMDSWWLIVFPGLFIFAVVYPLLLMGSENRKVS